jgi:hypothetical protein
LKKLCEKLCETESQYLNPTVISKTQVSLFLYLILHVGAGIAHETVGKRIRSHQTTRRGKAGALALESQCRHNEVDKAERRSQYLSETRLDKRPQIFFERRWAEKAIKGFN